MGHKKFYKYGTYFPLLTTTHKIDIDLRCWDVQNVVLYEGFSEGSELATCKKPFFDGIVPDGCIPKQCGCKEKSLWIGTKCECDKANGYGLMLYPEGVMTCECDQWDKNLVTDANGECVCKDRYTRVGDKCEIYLSDATIPELQEAYKKLQQCPE